MVLPTDEPRSGLQLLANAQLTDPERSTSGPVMVSLVKGSALADPMADRRGFWIPVDPGWPAIDGGS